MSKEFDLDKDGNVKETFRDVMRAYKAVYGTADALKKIDEVDHYAFCKTCIHYEACSDMADGNDCQYNRKECEFYLKDTRAEFAEKMREYETIAANVHDLEEAHIFMDDLMCETLRSLGYGEGVDIFENTHKWYA